MKASKILHQSIQSYIKMHRGADSIFILKGFSPEAFGASRFDLANLSVKRYKTKRIMELTQSAENGAAVLSYAEFLFLFSNIIDEFERIYILTNPLYLHMHPIYEVMDASVRASLLHHFDEDADEKNNDESVAGIDIYTKIYSNFGTVNGTDFCCYNAEPLELEKYDEIHEQVVLPQGEAAIQRIDSVVGSGVELANEKSYFEFVQKLLTADDRFTVFDGNIWLGKEAGDKRLEGLSLFFPGRIFLCSNAAQTERRRLPQDIYALMDKYWHTEAFRDIRFYDMGEIEQGRKVVSLISQGQIIGDMIRETESHIQQKSGRDIFVTAPTGAGKSLMFQLPAMYLAEKYHLLTLVISPLIGLMRDQVESLKAQGYTKARTINSDISPVEKQGILDEVANGECDILYLSPESLLAKNDIKQLIGLRQIGMIIIDEAHIVTTWGKQFRPDYWYLGDRIAKLRRVQMKGTDEIPASSFLIATFTATAIYHGEEDMYQETLESLHMINPITYLGYIKRDNIAIDVTPLVSEAKSGNDEYQRDKFDDLISTLHKAMLRKEKVLVYFPMISLIHRFIGHCESQPRGLLLKPKMSAYYGTLNALQKKEAQDAFHDGKKLIMLATKAFGMGIDIPDITTVIHFAPTGNVCDYMQEIGRAARKTSIDGHAVYHHSPHDFRYINQLYGMSAIRKSQLIGVMKKVLEMYTSKQRSGGGSTRKQHGMLVDAEAFSYIFNSTSARNDGDDNLAKVKTAMLIIQKDYERRYSYSPFVMRPVSLFRYGYFSVSDSSVKAIEKKYGKVCRKQSGQIYRVDLQQIWETSYDRQMSFPKFKYLVYTNDSKLSFCQYALQPATRIDVSMERGADDAERNILSVLRFLLGKYIADAIYHSEGEIIGDFCAKCRQEGIKMSSYMAESVLDVWIASMKLYQDRYSQSTGGRMITVYPRGIEVKYKFGQSSQRFCDWIGKEYRHIQEKLHHAASGTIFMENPQGSRKKEEFLMALGILESWNVLHFQSLGGAESQIYIYVNETQNMTKAVQNPEKYENRLLDIIKSRHYRSVKVLTYLYQSNLTSEEIWDEMEDYFLGLFQTSKLPQ